MVTTYYGLTWWDNEIDGDKMYPSEQRNPSEEDRYQTALRNPEAAAVRGLSPGARAFLKGRASDVHPVVLPDADVDGSGSLAGHRLHVAGHTARVAAVVAMANRHGKRFI